jgi:hypothetical protein
MEIGLDYWDVLSARSKWIAIIVLAVVLLSFSTCVFAQNAPDSNFGLVRYPGGVTMACYTPNGVPESSNIYTCLVTQQVGEDQWVTQGQVTFCTIVGVDGASGKPMFECGNYEAMETLSKGI